MTAPRNRPLQWSSRPGTARLAENLQMADALHYPDTRDDLAAEPDRESPPSTPRWVKMFGITAIVLLLLFAGLHLSGNAPMHLSSGAQHGMQAP